MKLLALIPARGGSKGIPKKNIRPFAGKPLIAHSIEAGKGSKYVDRVVITTDDAEIAEIAKSFGAEVPVLRPAEISGDKSPVMEAVIHMLDYLRDKEGYEPTHLLLLQTTSPLRRSSDIDAAVELFQNRGAESLVSMCRTENGLFTKDENDVVETVYDGYKSATNRQMLPKCYKLDGCMLYLIDVNVLREKRSFLGGKLIGFEIPRWRAVDLDDPEDFIVGELIHRNASDIEDKINAFFV
ncbi:MAG: acylneuraminate cytidylyltransferase family protein [Candidatus Uhrbacteria bacterium]|nr:acylneuraminate cytidylyltransferase family protein [Candidatus Uhrbacteria bacterium]